VFEKYVKGGSGNGVSVSMGAFRGEPRGGSFTGDFGRYVKEGSGNGTPLSV
jgi:hypothetical protein